MGQYTYGAIVDPQKIDALLRSVEARSPLRYYGVTALDAG